MEAIQGEVEKKKINRGALEPRKEKDSLLLYMQPKREHKAILYVNI